MREAFVLRVSNISQVRRGSASCSAPRLGEMMAEERAAGLPKDKFEASNRRAPLRSQPSKGTSEVLKIAHKNANAG